MSSHTIRILRNLISLMFSFKLDKFHSIVQAVPTNHSADGSSQIKLAIPCFCEPRRSWFGPRNACCCRGQDPTPMRKVSCHQALVPSWERFLHLRFLH